MDSFEYVLSRSPFIVRRTVRWGDCDPAGIVYTGRFPEYVLGAVNLFTAHIANGNLQALARELGVDTPCKGMTYEFLSSLWPNDIFDIHCSIGEIRTHTFDIVCAARKEDGTPVFNATFSPICIERAVRKSTPIPQQLRAILSRHIIN